MDAEERALQIKIAQLNARLQIYLAYFFGFLALGGGCVIGGYQLIVTVPKGISIQLFLASAILCFGTFSFAIGYKYVDKLHACRAELESLR